MVRKAALLEDRVLKFEATDEEVIGWYLKGVLEKVGGNQSEARRILDVARTTVRRRMAKLGLVAESPKASAKESPKDKRVVARKRGKRGARRRK